MDVDGGGLEGDVAGEGGSVAGSGDIEVIDAAAGGDDAAGSIAEPEEPPPHDAQPTAARMAIINLIAAPPRCYFPAMGSKTPL